MGWTRALGVYFDPVKNPSESFLSYLDRLCVFCLFPLTEGTSTTQMYQ
jgi:hypothetical protein